MVKNQTSLLIDQQIGKHAMPVDILVKRYDFMPENEKEEEMQ